MTELLLSSLLRQALLISVATALLWIARRPLLRLGATATYASWLLLPLLLLTTALPRPTREPLQLLLQTAAGPVMPALPALPAPVTHSAALWLASWLAGTAAVAAVQARRQWRLSRFGELLPAGSSPALVGLLRPRVALPADFEQRFSPAERELILAHEQVHRERLDNLWNLLACVLVALHWWNPLAWWAARRMQADQELACDAAVLARHPGSQPSYTQALMTAHDLLPARAPLASRWGSTHPLVERIAMLNRSRPLPHRRAAALGLALLGIASLAYAAQATPQTPSTGPRVELKMEISYRAGDASNRTTLTAKPTVHVHMGQRATVMLNGSPDRPSPEQIAIDVEASDLGDGKIQIQAEIRKGDPLASVSRPRLVTRNGVKALIEQGREDPAGVEHLSLAITPTMLAEAKP